jgi:pimeloyl-ACP methyl ester carboxylesterase
MVKSHQDAPMARATNGDIEIEYETFGDPGDPTLLLVMGLGAQLVSWEPEFCQGLVDRGFHVVRFDNRDVGLSTKVEAEVDLMTAIGAALSGGPVQAPYLLTDMAADAMAVLDDLGVASAHVVGASMGGMIAQTIAIEHPERVRSLTTIMSTTGDPDVGMPREDVLPVLLDSPPPQREAAIEHGVGVSRTIGSPDHFEEDRARAKATLAYDRCFHPAGTGRQLLAILASGSRSDDLRACEVPALVIHGDLDPLVQFSGGQRTHECLGGSELLVLEGMGHDMPTAFWPQIIEGITSLASRVPA